jgi:hypothetical protein
VHLGQPAIDVLLKIMRVEKNPWVIVGTKPGARLTDLQPFWQRVRARAGLKDVRIHDLRYTFASTAVASGQGLPMIGKLLGHAQVQTTARYAHLAADPSRTPPTKLRRASRRRSIKSLDHMAVSRSGCKSPCVYSCQSDQLDDILRASLVIRSGANKTERRLITWRN